MADDGKRLNGGGLDQVWKSMQLYVQDHAKGGGTVTSVTAGDGLSGGTITTSGTIAVKPATETEIGGVKVAYDEDTKSLYITSNNEATKKVANFYDYDGTLVYSYTKEEFLALENLPQNPIHSGLIGQGWNWTLQEAKDYLEEHDLVNIGQMYTTDDGKTRVYVELDDLHLNPSIYLITFENNTLVEIDWGDGLSITTVDSGETGCIMADHTYSQPGDYIISINPKNNKNMGIVGEGYYTGYALSYLLWNGSGSSWVDADYLNTIKKIEIGSNISRIGSGGLSGCRFLESVTIPREVVMIQYAAFTDDLSLKHINIPNGLEDWPAAYSGTDQIEPSQIGYSTFAGCADLKRIVLPGSSLKLINWDAFFIDINLEDICIPPTIEEMVGYGMFEGCENLSELKVSMNTQWTDCQYTFSYCSNLKKTSFININLNSNNLEMLLSGTYDNSAITSISNFNWNSINFIGLNMFANCHYLKNAYIANTIEHIGPGAFQGCWRLKNVTFPNNLNSIGDNAFRYTFIANLTFPNTLTYIGNNAFSYCNKIKEITLPSSITTIGNAAFSYCASLAKILVSKNILTIPENTFNYAKVLRCIDFTEHESVPTLPNLNAFSGIQNDYKIVVPDSLYNDWIAATNWSNLTSHIVKRSDYYGS